jgi:hypothetical protein
MRHANKIPLLHLIFLGESGQDVSSRFGPQQTGGTIIQHVRPVDLQASMAQAAAILARWASLLMEEGSGASTPGFAEEIAWWHTIAGEFSARTRQMWRHGWFRDYDAVSGEWSEQRDAMHLAPVFCGVAERVQVEQLHPYLARPPMHSSGWAPLCWPPVVMMLVGAAAAAQMPMDAAELAYLYIDASYRGTDSRELDEQGGIPSVTREYHATVTQGKWGEVDYVNAGIEGYGWGALGVHLLIRHILGLRALEAGSIEMAPTFPRALRRAGAAYSIGPIAWGTCLLYVSCVVRDDQRYQMQVRCTPVAQAGEEIPGRAEQQEWSWDAKWGEGRALQLPRL